MERTPQIFMVKRRCAAQKLTRGAHSPEFAPKWANFPPGVTTKRCSCVRTQTHAQLAKNCSLINSVQTCKKRHAWWNCSDEKREVVWNAPGWKFANKYVSSKCYFYLVVNIAWSQVLTSFYVLCELNFYLYQALLIKFQNFLVGCILVLSLQKLKCSQ